MNYEKYITHDYLISPINGYKTKRISSQNVKQFGFETIEDLENNLPHFPRVCQSSSARFSSEHSKLGAKTTKQNNIIKNDKLKCEYNANPLICVCGNTISFEKKNNKFCSRKCANKRNHSLETKNKISTSLIKAGVKPPKTLNQKIRKIYDNYRTCKKCDSILQYRESTCKKCANTIQLYRQQCKFNFNLSDFPREFDLDLLKTHGMYSPSNSKKPNIYGVSRDHMVSVHYGFENRIDHKIISHPANCKLILHVENSKKHRECSLSIEELLLRIEIWDDKYPK